MGMGKTISARFGIAKSIVVAIVSVFSVIETHKASAQEFWPPPDAPMSTPFEMTLGLGVANGPAYLGSDERRTLALPLVAARWKNGWFAGTGGIGLRIPSDSRLSGGVRLGFDRGRDENDAAALEGMGDIKLRPEIGAFASCRLVPFLRLGSSIRIGSGNDRDGALADFSLRGILPLANGHRLFAGLTATVANNAAMQSQFGVNATQSAKSGYSIYEPGAGLRDLNLTLGYGHKLTERMMIQGGVGIRHLLADAKDCPFTRDSTGLSAFILLGYRL